MLLDFKGLTSASSRIVLAWSSSVGVKIFMRVARVAVFSVVSGLGCILRRDRKCQGRRQAALLRISLSFHRGCCRESNDVMLFILHDTLMEFFMRKNYMKIKRRLECGPMPNLMVALLNIGGALCSTPQSLADAHY